MDLSAKKKFKVHLGSNKVSIGESIYSLKAYGFSFGNIFFGFSITEYSK